MFAPPSLDADPTSDHDRFRLFLRWQLFVAALFGLLILGTYIQNPRASTLLSLLVLLGYTASVVGAFLLARYRSLRVARLALASALLVIGPIGIALTPLGLAPILLASMLAVAIALPTLDSRRAWRLLTLAWVQMLGVTMIANFRLQNVDWTLLDWLTGSVEVGALACLTLWIIWEQHRQQAALIVALNDTQQALYDANEGMEQQVRNRTEELVNAEVLTRQLAGEHERLLAVAQAMLEPLTIEAVIERTDGALQQLLPFEAFGLYWLDTHANMLRPRYIASTVLKRGVVESWDIPIEQGIVGSVVRSGQGELVNHAEHDPRTVYAPGEQPGIEHLIAIPVRARETTLGVFFISRHGASPFTIHEFELVQLLLSYASLGIANAQLLQETRISEANYRTLFAESRDVIFRSTPAGHVLDINQAGVELFGYSRDELLALDHVGRLYAAPEDREALKQAIAINGFVQDYELTLRHRNGRELIMLETATAVRDEQNAIVAYRGIIRDITASKRAEDALQAANAQLAGSVLALQQRTYELTQLSKMSELLQGCRAVPDACAVGAQFVERMFPYARGAISLISTDGSELVPTVVWGKHTQPLVPFPTEMCWAAQHGRPRSATMNAAICEHSGHASASSCIPLISHAEVLGILHLEWITSADVDHADEAAQQLLTTIGEQLALAMSNLQLRETLSTQAISDSLTGLYNRRFMEESLARELRRASRNGTSLGIAMLDLDHFKRFNDAFGHPAGDTLLREIGRFIRQRTRAEDIACRYGGEEFTLIMRDAALPDLVRRAEELRQGVRQLDIVHRGQALGPITMSVGIAIFPDHADTIESLLRAADAALYAAKAAGRDCVVVGGILRER